MNIVDPIQNGEVEASVNSKVGSILTALVGSTALASIASWAGVISNFNTAVPTAQQLVPNEFGYTARAKLNWANTLNNVVDYFVGEGDELKANTILANHFSTRITGTQPSLYLGFDDLLISRPPTTSRATAATVVDGAGQIVVVPADTPRYDWETGRRGLLIEAAQTNLALYSEPASDAQTTNRSGISYVAGFDGFANAVAFGDNSENRFCYVGPSLVADSVYTIYAYVRMDDGGAPVVALGNSGSHDFTLILGGSATAGVVKPVVHLGGGLYRVGMTRTPAGAVANNGIVKYSGLSNRGFRVTGFQVFAGDVEATSYIKTTGSALTRAGDFASIDLSDMDLSGGYTVLVAGRSVGTRNTGQYVVRFDQGSADPYQGFGHISSSSDFRTVVRADAVTTVTENGGCTFDTDFVAGYSVGPNICQTARGDGTLSVIDPAVDYRAPSLLRLGHATGSGGQPAQLHLYKVALWPAVLTGTDLQAAREALL